jgi:5-methylcytosine-specific restriction endonuclease McrA
VEHERAPPHISALCDSLVAGIPGTTANIGKNWCSIGKPTFAFVQHTRSALTVFLRCNETDGTQLSKLIDSNSTLLLSSRQNLGSAWAKTTPYFLKITTPGEASAAIPLLLHVARTLPRNRRQAAVALPSEDAVADHWEGNRAVVYVNRYERDPKARAACIKLFGASCAVCGLDFSQRYGAIGDGFIHVHHLTPLSAVGLSHKINPQNDLRPVCPNCHEMLHKRSPPFSIDELKALIRVS